MPDTIDPPIHEDALPGHESRLEPKPDWKPRYPGSGRLAGKVALVTGGDSGIGRAVAVLFAREGADVAIAHLCEDDDAAATAEAIEAEAGRSLILRGDLGDSGFAREAVERTIAEFGRLDVLVNNAGEQHPDAEITDITEDQLRRTFQTNIFSMFFLVQAAMPHLRKGAAIINTTSITGYEGAEQLLDYASTKGAITSFTRSLAANLVDKGIRVNAVAPGPIWTPLNPFGGTPPEEIEAFGTSVPMGRPGQPNEVAPAYLYLACEDGSYVTGQVLHVNGGTPAAG